ncbi:hypothetical protein GKQ38_04610 [Candidatus Nanohaloarchaea archaeon]|nr:hypothetical protein GKQ38_04610 [Candidatus Nanohaloarchaea archaeon]
MDEEFSDSLAVLRDEPEGTNIVEEALEDEYQEGQRFDLPEMDDCALCRIDKTPHTAGENIYWRDSDDNYVVEAANKKGHPVRNMMVYGDHGYFPTDADMEMQDEDPFRRLFEISASQVYHSEDIDDDQLIQTVGMNSVPGHAHVMASNLDIEADETTDHALTGSYIRWDLSDGDYSFENPDEVMIRDSIGREVLDRMYRNSLGLSPEEDYGQASARVSEEPAFGMD